MDWKHLRFVSNIILIYSIASLSPGVLSVIVAVVSTDGASAFTLGLLGFFEYGGMAAAAILATALLKSKDALVISRYGGLLLFAGSLASASMVDNMMMLLATRLVAGFGGGLMMAGSLAAAARYRNPEQIYAFAGMGLTLLGTFGMIASPILVSIRDNASGIYLFIATFALIGVVASTMSKARSSRHQSPQNPEAASEHISAEDGSPPRLDRTLYLLATGATILFAVSDMAVWHFSTLIGQTIGVSLAKFGMGILLATLCGCALAPIAARIGSRFGILYPISGGLFIGAASVLTMTTSRDPLQFQIALCLFVIGQQIFVPAFQGLFARADPTGRLISAALGAKQIGLSIGPVAGGLLVDLRTNSFTTLGGVSAAMMLASLVTAYFLVLRARRQSHAPQASLP